MIFTEFICQFLELYLSYLYNSYRIFQYPFGSFINFFTLLCLLYIVINTFQNKISNHEMIKMKSVLHKCTHMYWPLNTHARAHIQTHTHTHIYTHTHTHTHTHSHIRMKHGICASSCTESYWWHKRNKNGNFFTVYHPVVTNTWFGAVRKSKLYHVSPR